jgi:hypothetical protein
MLQCGKLKNGAAKMPRKALDPDAGPTTPMQVRVPVALRKRAKSLLAEKEKEASLVRDAIERECVRREKAKQ